MRFPIGRSDAQLHCYTQSENIKHFEGRAVSVCAVRMPSSQDEKQQFTIYNEILHMRVYSIPIISWSVCGQYKRAERTFMFISH